MPFDRALRDFKSTVWNYRTTDHNPRGHPCPCRSPPTPSPHHHRAANAHGRRVDYADIVICPQRPKTARGVIFVTLEDENGFVNVIVWRHVCERFRSTVKTLSFMCVSGPLQNESNLVHLV